LSSVLKNNLSLTIRALATLPPLCCCVS